jgi:hypothetical protein
MGKRKSYRVWPYIAVTLGFLIAVFLVCYIILAPKVDPFVMLSGLSAGALAIVVVVCIGSNQKDSEFGSSSLNLQYV